MGTEWSQDEGSKFQNEEQRDVQKPRKNDIEREIDIFTREVQQQQQQQYPHNHEQILKDADAADKLQIDKSSTEKLRDRLQRGVFLNQKRKKYWIDNNVKNCFMLYARDLSITWGEDGKYWLWPTIKESSNESLIAAELINVCWLEVHGRFNTDYLTPRTRYEVFFIVMLKDPAYGWEVPVNVRLVLADGTRKERKENMMNRLRGTWIEIPAGEYTTTPDNSGEMEISLYEYEAGIWRRGLVIKGVIIRAKN